MFNKNINFFRKNQKKRFTNMRSTINILENLAIKAKIKRF